ncbi:MAG: glutamine--tRNA ligase [Acidobacteria bacterium]|nr:MAG: glutamine--tRNA ligase [Acidobacteriota bacterium]
MNDETKTKEAAESVDFIRRQVAADIEAGVNDGRVLTRFPPEPNGYLHIGHAKAICISYGIAGEYGFTPNLRFDDTNPIKEEDEYVDAIKRDIAWLGFDWGSNEFFTSDYFGQLFEWAQLLITKGKAYVCDLAGDEVKATRGTLTEAGSPSPFRDRSVEENLDLFRRMKAGEFPDGSRTLRAKIDMAAPNLNLRDPVMYRILHAEHHRTGAEWCIYPMYDWAHGQSDAIEKITHSLCSLEFENHRPLYEWYLEAIGIEGGPRQIEFARLNLNYTMMSKRKLLQLVEEGLVGGWDDPRMPTLSGLRRRGYTPESIRTFAEKVGVAKRDSVVDIALLEWAIRDHLNTTAPRVMGVLRPLKVVIENYPKDQVDEFNAPYLPDDHERMGTRKVPFSREIWVEQSDFMEEPHRKFWRLAPGREVRLRWAYLVTCTDVVKNDEGEVIEVRCTYDPESRGGSAPDGRRVRGTIHWVSARHALDAEVRLYDRLFVDPNPGAGGADFREQLNPESLEVLTDAKVEPSLATIDNECRVQFERQGYFVTDMVDHQPGKPVFNRTVPLRDSWAKIAKKM